MGLDLVEFVMDVENAFGLTIPDADAAALNTPRKLIDYLHGRLPTSTEDYSLADCALQKLQTVIARDLNIPASTVRPGTSLMELFPGTEGNKVWAAIRQRIGASKWPRIGKRGWFSTNPNAPNLSLLSEVVDFMVERTPMVLKQQGEGWTRKQIGEVVHRLIVADLLGNSPYTEDSRFSDMGVT